MAEALACATPVLAYPHGAAPEIIETGRTGYLCTDDADMIAALGRLDRLDRDACRAAAKRRFSLARMAADHERLYRRVLTVGRLHRSPPVQRTHQTVGVSDVA